MATTKTRRMLALLEEMAPAHHPAPTILPVCGAGSPYGPCEGVRGHFGCHIAGDWVWGNGPFIVVNTLMPATVCVVD